MAIDSDPVPRHVTHLVELAPADERRNLNMYDVSLHRGLNRLDIGPNTPPRDSAGAWASEANKAVQDVRVNPPTVRFEDQQQPLSYGNPNPLVASRSLHQQTMSAPSMAARDGKRHGWYNGPVSGLRDQAPPVQQDPRMNHVDRIVHPNFNGFSGFPARDQPPPPQEQPQRQPPGNGEPLGRLEALVAVATGEGSTAAAY